MRFGRMMDEWIGACVCVDRQKVRKKYTKKESARGKYHFKGLRIEGERMNELIYG